MRANGFTQAADVRIETGEIAIATEFGDPQAAIFPLWQSVGVLVVQHLNAMLNAPQFRINRGELNRRFFSDMPCSCERAQGFNRP